VRRRAASPAYKRLGKLAVRVMALCGTATETERCWKDFDHVVSLRRNRLKHERASKLVRLYSHLRRERERPRQPIALPACEGEDDEDVVVVGEDACAAEDAVEHDWDVIQADADEADIQHIVIKW